MECTRLFPPYFKHAIFFFCGIELLYSALVMAINQKFWDLSSKIFPIAYRMFNDTVLKGEPEDFKWGPDEWSQLNTYQEKLKLMWLSSTLVVICSMLCIVPQFCTSEAADGEEITYCVKKPALGRAMAPLLSALVLCMGVMLTWQWSTCTTDHDLFQRLFRASQKEEAFLTEFEQQLNCISDDDKELARNWECDNTIDRSMLNEKWMDPIYYAFFVCHTLMIAGLSLLNKEFGHNILPKELLLSARQTSLSDDEETSISTRNNNTKRSCQQQQKHKQQHKQREHSARAIHSSSLTRNDKDSNKIDQ